VISVHGRKSGTIYDKELRKFVLRVQYNLNNILQRSTKFLTTFLFDSLWPEDSSKFLAARISFSLQTSLQSLTMPSKLETKASSNEGQCIPAGCRVTLPRRALITMSIITMRSRPFPANSSSDCLRFAKPRPQFSNLVAPSTDGSAKCLVRYKVHLLF